MKALTKTLFALAFSSINLLGQSPLILNIEIEKGTYLLGEPVQIAISIVNKSSSKASENLWGRITVTLFESTGKKVQRLGLQVQNRLPGMVELEPNEEEYRVIELNEHFGEVYSVATAHHYFDVGRYSIKVTLKIPNQIEQTRELVFNVIEPSGEERIVYDKYVDLVKGRAKDKYNDSQVVEILSSLYSNYPNSVYTPVLLTLLQAVYYIWLNETTKAVAIQKDLIEKYPTSVQSWRMLEELLKRMSSDSERVEYLKKIHSSAKGSLMEKVFEKQLQAATAKVKQ